MSQYNKSVEGKLRSLLSAKRFSYHSALSKEVFFSQMSFSGRYDTDHLNGDLGCAQSRAQSQMISSGRFFLLWDGTDMHPSVSLRCAASRLGFRRV